jgi:ribosomal protein S18 acetylase RimI-like enzyme
MEQLVAFGEQFYRDRGGSPRLLVSKASAPVGLEGYLLEREYLAHDRTLVMTIDTAALLERATPGAWTVELSAQATLDWFACYWQAELPRPLNSAEGDIHRQTLLVPATASCFALLKNGRDGVAVGQVVFGGSWGGLQCIATAAAYRRRGAAGAVLHELATRASDAGVSRLYLVVLADNLPAISLYTRLGFAAVHEYTYFTR